MRKLDIIIAVPGLPFNGLTFDDQSLGGSESAGYYMARALARLGHRVMVFGNGAPVSCADVDYLPLPMFRPFAESTQHDVCIVQRAPELLAAPIRSRFTALWCHDLALLRKELTIKGCAWNFDKIFTLSNFMNDQYKKVYGFEDETLFQTRNGVDLETVAKARQQLIAANAARDPFRMVYSSRPERGMDILLGEIMPRVLRAEPRAKLALCTYDNSVDHMQDFYNHCRSLAQQLGDRVQFVGHLPKVELYKLFQQSSLFAYPLPSKIAADFDEVSCIGAMEAQACGLPIVTTKRGALPETIHPSAGTLIDLPIHTAEFYDAFAAECVRLMNDRAAWQEMSKAGRDHAMTLDWVRVAEQWSELFEREIYAQSANKASLVNHFWRRSDIYAAKALLKQIDPNSPEGEASEFVRERIEKDWAFLDEEDGFRKQYEKIGLTHTDVFNAVPHEPRFQALWQWFNQHPQVRDVLDYGCAHGGYALNMAERTGIKFTGLDIDKHSVAIALRQRTEKCKTEAAQKCEFFTLDEFGFGKPDGVKKDAAIAFEVLEHVADPSALIRQLEQHVKDGGYVVITVPFGPWEYSSYRNYPHRCHVWEFDTHDLREMFDCKGKASDIDLRIQAMPAGSSPEMGEALGWWFVSYRVTPETRGKVGSIDMERKLKLQRPRQTVSACVIAGPNAEETILWSLRSLEHVADEIVVVDCGMSELAKQLLTTLPLANVKLVKGVDPKTEGFETPRNIGLEYCTQDWVLWIDMDERLIAADQITKYLRSNRYSGYSIRQHHFAVDTHFDPDLPVRLFRNPRYTKSGMRWYGMIHEHPETGLNKGPGQSIVLGEVHIAHVGYLHEPGRQRKFSRNYPMLEADKKKYPDRLLQKHFIMRDNMLLVNYELRMNGGKRTPAIEARCRETIELYRKHFMGKGHFTNVDPSQYHSQALAVLGEGFEVAFGIAADKAQARPNGSHTMRFANAEDAVTEIGRRVRDVTQQFDNQYW